MSRTLIATFWASAVLMTTANTTVLASEPVSTTTGSHDLTAAWLEFRIDDDMFAQPAYGQFGVAPATNPVMSLTASLGETASLGGFSVRPFSSLAYAGPDDDTFASPLVANAVGESLIGAIGVQTSALFDSGLGPLEALIDLYLAHEMDIDGVRLRTMPGSLKRNIHTETANPEEFDFENALSFRIRGMLPGFFQYETRIRVRSTGIQEITGGIRFRW